MFCPWHIWSMACWMEFQGKSAFFSDAICEIWRLLKHIHHQGWRMCLFYPAFRSICRTFRPVFLLDEPWEFPKYPFVELFQMWEKSPLLHAKIQWVIVVLLHWNIWLHMTSKFFHLWKPILYFRLFVQFHTIPPYKPIMSPWYNL